MFLVVDSDRKSIFQDRLIRNKPFLSFFQTPPYPDGAADDEFGPVKVGHFGQVFGVFADEGEALEMFLVHFSDAFDGGDRGIGEGLPND